MKFLDRIYVNSLDGLFFYQNNRCFTNDKKICKELGFSEQSISIFERRKKKISKSIKEFSYLECCEIKLFLLNKKLYIGDGQGRLACLEDENNGKREDEKKSIPCLIYEVSSEQEMSDAIRAMNMYGTNWSQLDNIRCKIRTSNDEDSINKLKKINDIMSYLGINNSNACDMVLGQGSRKRDTDWSKRNEWEDIDDFANWLASIYDLCEKENWTKEEIKRLKSQKFLEAIKENIYKKTKKYAPLMLQEVKSHLTTKICLTERELRSRFTNNKDYLKRLFIDLLDTSRKKTMKEVVAILRDR